MFSVPSQISSNDRVQIEVVREALKDLLAQVPTFDTDFNILRWLQGWDYKIDQMLPLLRDHLRFHLCWGLDGIFEEKMNEICVKHYPRGLFPTPVREGSDTYLFIEALGMLDNDGLFKAVRLLEILRDRVKMAEEVAEHLKKHERATGRQAHLYFLLDLHGLVFDFRSVYNMATGAYKCLCLFFSRHYAEQIGTLMVINSPSFFAFIWSALRPLLGQKTREKTQILGPDWKSEVLKHVAIDRLPVHWGGTLVDEDGDPMCRSIINVPPGKVPKELYWHPSAKDPTPSELTELRVAAGHCEFLTFKITEANTTLKWYYTTADHHWFGIFFTENEADTNVDTMEMIFPHLYLPGLVIPEQNSLNCPKVGYVKVKFGNESAWFYSIHVKHWFKLV